MSRYETFPLPLDRRALRGYVFSPDDKPLFHEMIAHADAARRRDLALDLRWLLFMIDVVALIRSCRQGGKIETRRRKDAKAQRRNL